MSGGDVEALIVSETVEGHWAWKGLLRFVGNLAAVSWIASTLDVGEGDGAS